MQRILKLGVFSVLGLVLIAVTGAMVLSYGASDPLGNALTSWRFLLFKTQTFAPVAAENQPLTPDPLTFSARALDTETPRPPVGGGLDVIIENQGGSAFPVLVPTGFADTPETIAATRLRLRLLADGYYAVFQSVTMEITIIGTRKVWTDTSEPIEAVQGNYVMPFEDPGPIPAGGAITFGHFGADYSVSFDCVDTSPGQRRNCITKEAALDFVTNLIAGTPTNLRIPALVSS